VIAPALISLGTANYKNVLLSREHEFHELNIFIGPNGSGKTNAIRLLQFLKACVAGPPNGDTGGGQLAHAAGILGGARMLDRSLRFPGSIDIAYHFVPPPHLQDQWISLTLRLGIYAHSAESAVSLFFESLFMTAKQERTSPYFYYKFHEFPIGSGVISYYDEPRLPKSHFEQIDVVPTDALGLAVLPDLLEKFPHPPDLTPVYPVRRSLIDYIKKWHFYNANDMNFEEIRTAEPKIGPPDMYLSPSGNNLALVLDNLTQRHVEFDERLNAAMKAILPRTRRVRAVRTGLMGLSVEWYFDDVDSPFYLREMSDGTVRMLCWATILLSPQLPTLLVIDEPEMGIHPAWLPVLAEWIKAASRKTQVIVSTHSSDLLDHFTDYVNNVLCFTTKDGKYFAPESLSPDRLASKLEEGWQLGDLYRVGDPLVGGWPW